MVLCCHAAHAVAVECQQNNIVNRVRSAVSTGFRFAVFFPFFPVRYSLLLRLDLVAH